MTLGQEFRGWSGTLGKDLDRMEELAQLFATVNLGGTAIGTGINTDPKYASTVIQKLAEVAGFDVKAAPDLIDASSDMGDLLLFSGMLRRLAVKLSKIANDLRLLSSGPRSGFNDMYVTNGRVEIVRYWRLGLTLFCLCIFSNLPAVQPGSSIMPGKVNPVIPEAMNQAAYQVIGNDVAITFAAEAGQLQLNAMEPLIIYNMLSNLRMLTNACNMMTDRCVVQITANVERCESMVRDSIGIVTAFSPFIGYEKSTAIAKEALVSGRNVIDLIKEEGLLTEEKIESIMKPENLTGPSSLLSIQKIPDLNREFTHMRVSSVDASFFSMTVLQEELAASGHRRSNTHSMFPRLPSIRNFSLSEEKKESSTT